MFRILAAAAAAGAMLSTPVRADELKIDDLVVAASTSPAEREATVAAATAFYQFWNTGDEALLNSAIADTFVDRTLPAGRPQGPQGPAFENFRTAVPDLTVEVRKMIMAGDMSQCICSSGDISRASLDKPREMVRRSISSPPTCSRSPTVGLPTIGTSRTI
jgi:hypothetical protein